MPFVQGDRWAPVKKLLRLVRTGKPNAVIVTTSSMLSMAFIIVFAILSPLGDLAAGLIRYRDENNRPQIAATLNGTLATTRWIVAILENRQQADGSVRVPRALRPYLGLEELKPVG